MPNMSGLLQKLLGGQPSASPIPSPEDADFADFAGAPSPTPITPIPSASSASSTLSEVATPTDPTFPQLARPYTKWYRVWERVYPSDFRTEMYILPFIILVLAFHFYGTRTNRRRMRSWLSVHAPTLEREYALVGFAPHGTRMVSEGTLDPMELVKEKTPTEYVGYATGRQNVAFSDLRVTLNKRHNPAGRIGEEAVGFVFESQPAPRERVEVTSFAFDGREHDLAPLLSAEKDASSAEKEPEKKKKETFGSTYDNFVFAIVHKDMMKKVRDGRYDLSLTNTKEHSRLPFWTVLMSESAEISEALLTPELCDAVKRAGDLLEMLIVTDQPEDQPKKLNDALPRKKLYLSIRLPSSSKPSSYDATLPLFSYFLRLPDHLASFAHFRPEALKRIKATREEEAKKIRRIYEDEKAEERRLKAEKEKKEERDRKLRSLRPEEQRRVLDRERASDLRKGSKRKTLRA